MSDSVFKRLFEIQILHDYFLTTADGTSFFDKNEADKRELLKAKLAYSLYDIKDIFLIEPAGTTALRMSEYKLTMHKTALGFIVGAEVNTVNQAGETYYKPRYDLNNSVNLTFSITPKLTFFNSITNLSFSPPVPAIYYFTNKGKEEFNEAVVPAYKSLPLADKVMEHQNGKSYEMGTVVNFGGTIREALQHTDGNNPAHWEDIEDKRFVTEADRILLPPVFSYTFNKEDDVTQFEALLEDESNNEIKKISKNSVEAMESVLLNFTKIDETDEDSEDILTGFYTLKVKINERADVVYPVYLNSEIYLNDYLGVVDIRLDEINSPFSLLDSSGFLKTKIDASNQKISHPVFEIRFKNRRTYWRYNREGDFSPAEVAATSAHLQHQSEKLISKKPKALTETLAPFKNGTSLMLPHPGVPSVKVEKEKVVSEIFINQSNRLLSN